MRTFIILSRLDTAGIPHFMKRCALTRDLYNLITEFRLTMTSAGLAEHIKRKYRQQNSWNSH